MVRLILAVSLAAACAVGCAGRGRHSAQCAWPSEHALSLDLKNPAQLGHLHDDAKAAETIAGVYADSKRGAAKPGDHRQATETCEAVLFSAVARVHGVSPDQVRTALRRQNDTPF